MYITFGLTAAYTASSYYYNYNHYRQANNYRQKAGVSLKVMQGRLTSLIEGITSGMYNLLLSSKINKKTLYNQLIALVEAEKLRDSRFLDKDFSDQFKDLINYIEEFGVHNMQIALNSLLEGEDLEELPYLYMPYHQYIKPSIAMIGVSEFICQQFDRIKLLYDYQTGHLDTMGIIEKYGIESISTLRFMRADFSNIREWNISLIIIEHGIEYIDILKDSGAIFNNMDRYIIFSIVNKCGMHSIMLLKDAGADFAKLYGYDIVDIAKKHGKDALQRLKDAGSDFNMLGPDDIAHLIIRHGLEIIHFLVNDLDVKLSKMGGGDIVSVANIYGKDVIHLLHKAGANLSVLSLSNVLYIIDIYGEEVICLLQDVGVDFTQLSEEIEEATPAKISNSVINSESLLNSKVSAAYISDSVINSERITNSQVIPAKTSGRLLNSKVSAADIPNSQIISSKILPDSLFDSEVILDKYYNNIDKKPEETKSSGYFISSIIKRHGSKCIYSLRKAGFNFSNLDRDGIKYIIDKNGVDSIELLNNVGADFSILSLSDVLSVIDNYGEEVISLLQDSGIDFAKLSEDVNEKAAPEYNILDSVANAIIDSIDSEYLVFGIGPDYWNFEL